MQVPQWLSLLIAGAVIVFGCYRLWIGVRGPSDEARAKARRGLLALPRRQHVAVGVLYLLVGSALLATSFGFNPFRRQAPAETAPAAGSNDRTSIPIAP